MGMGAAAIRAGQAFVEILAEDSKARRVLKRFQADMQSWATTMNNLGRAMLLPAVGIGIGLGKATKTFAEFEQEMSKVLARLDKADLGFEKLKKAALEMGKTTAFSATQAAQAMTNFAEAGYDSAQISAVLKPTIDLAAAGMMDLAEASDIVITTLNTFNLKAEEIPHVIDIIAKGSLESASDVKQMAQAFTYASAVASTAGMPLHELVGVLSMLHDAGIKADMAGTSMRGILLALASPSKEAADTMRMLGINIADANGNMISFDKIIAQFQRSLKGVGSVQKLNVIGKIFDSRQAAGISKLIDFGAVKIQERIKTVFNSQGAAAEAARIQLNNLAGDFKRLQGAMEAFAITIIGAVVEPLRNTMQALRTTILLVNEWAEANPEVVRTVLAVAAAVVVAAPALIALSVAMKLAAFAFEPLFLAMTGLRVAILASIPVIKTVVNILAITLTSTLRLVAATVTKIVIGAFAGLGAAVEAVVTAITAGFMWLLANPIALLGIALAGIALYAIYMSNIWAKAIANMKKAWSNFTFDAGKGWTALMKSIEAGRMDLAFKALSLTMELAFLDMVDALHTTWEDFSLFFADTWDNAITNAAIGMTRFMESFNKGFGILNGMGFGKAGEKGAAMKGAAGAAGAAGGGGQFSVSPESKFLGDKLRAHKRAAKMFRDDKKAEIDFADKMEREHMAREKERIERKAGWMREGNEKFDAEKPERQKALERLRQQVPREEAVKSEFHKKSIQNQEAMENTFRDRQQTFEQHKANNAEVLQRRAADRARNRADDGGAFIRQRDQDKTIQPRIDRQKYLQRIAGLDQKQADQAGARAHRAEQQRINRKYNRDTREITAGMVREGIASGPPRPMEEISKDKETRKAAATDRRVEKELKREEVKKNFKDEREMRRAQARSAYEDKRVEMNPNYKRKYAQFDPITGGAVNAPGAGGEGKGEGGMAPLAPDTAEGLLLTEQEKRAKARREAVEEARQNRRKIREGKLGELDFTKKEAEQALKSGKGKSVDQSRLGGGGGLEPLGKTSVVGTFSAAAAAGLAAGDTFGGRIAAATEKTAKGVEQLTKKKEKGIGK